MRCATIWPPSASLETGANADKIAVKIVTVGRELLLIPLEICLL